MIFEKIREKLQKQLKAYEEFAGTQFSIEYENKCEVGVQATKEAIDIISQVEAEYNNGWISVNDRLPEIGLEVNVFTKSGNICSGIYYDYKYNNDELPCFHKWDNEMYGCFTPNVTHWQPLPQPPKGE